MKAVLLVLISASPILGDSWPLPEPKKIYSSNKLYYIEIIPRKLESQAEVLHRQVRRCRARRLAERPEGQLLQRHFLQAKC